MTSPARQLAMVLDLNKCIGCQTCTIACKRQWTRDEGMEAMWWNTVNTRPGLGTPRGWDRMGGGFEPGGRPRAGRLPTRAELGEAWTFDHDRVLFGAAGETSHLGFTGRDGLPTEPPTWGPNWDEDQGDGDYPNSYFFYLPRLCNHCTHPACLAACPRGAIVKRERDGIVLVDEDRCRGYRFCVEACPYKKIYFNHASKVSQKCIFCFPRVENGVANACARQCPGRVRFVGYRDDAEGPVARLVDEWKVAVPLRPDLGTGPNVFYVPPLSPPRFTAEGELDLQAPRIPDDFIESLFGPAGLEALAVLKDEMRKARAGGASPVLDTLIAYEWKAMFGGLDRDPATLERARLRAGGGDAPA